MPLYNNQEVIIAGDFNIDLLQINDLCIVADYFDMLTSYNFYPRITVPTRLSNKHGTLIDNFLCKLTEKTIHTTSGVLIKMFSDHQPYFTVIDNVQHCNSSPTNKLINKQDKESINKFHKETSQSLQNASISDSLTTDPNVNYNILHNIIQHAKNKYMPQKLVKFHIHKHQLSAWITQGIIKSIQYRDKLCMNHKMTDTNSVQFSIQKINLKTYNGILKNSIHLAKKDIMKHYSKNLKMISRLHGKQLMKF